MGKRSDVVQRHHLEYQPGLKFKDKIGETVKIWKGEHWVITQLQRRTLVSKGLIKALEFWIAQVKDIAVDLDMEQD